MDFDFLRYMGTSEDPYGCLKTIRDFLKKFVNLQPGNALAWVQRVHEPADLWEIIFCTC